MFDPRLEKEAQNLPPATGNATTTTTRYACRLMSETVTYISGTPDRPTFLKRLLCA